MRYWSFKVGFLFVNLSNRIASVMIFKAARAIEQSDRDRRADRFAYETYEMQDARRDLQVKGEKP